MKLEQYLALGAVSGLKFQSILDTIDGNQYVETIWTCSGISTLFYNLCLNTLESNDAYPIRSLKPICRPISDLTKPIEHGGEKFVPIERLRLEIVGGWCEMFSEAIEAIELFVHESDFEKIDYLPFIFINYFIEWHFAIGDFDFIPVTEEFNPYK